MGTLVIQENGVMGEIIDRSLRSKLSLWNSPSEGLGHSACTSEVTLRTHISRRLNILGLLW